MQRMRELGDTVREGIQEGGMREGEGFIPYLYRRADQLGGPMMFRESVGAGFDALFGGQPSARSPTTPAPEDRPLPEPMEPPRYEDLGIPNVPAATNVQLEDMPRMSVEEDLGGYNPALEEGVNVAKARRERMLELLGPERGRLQRQLQIQESLPYNLFKMGGAAVHSLLQKPGEGTPAFQEVWGGHMKELDGMRSRLLQLGLTEEELNQAVEDATIAQKSGQYETDVAVATQNFQSSMEDARQANAQAVRSADQQDARNMASWQLRASTAIERAKQIYAQSQAALGALGSLGGGAGVRSFETMLAPLGDEMQEAGRERLRLQGLTGLISREIRLAGGDEGRAIRRVRQRMEAIFRRRGLTPPPPPRKQVFADPQLVAEYYSSANPEILGDPELDQFFPGLPAPTQ